MSTTAAHYESLYESLCREVGDLSNETLTGIVGFGAGGPVSMVGVPGHSVFVTCELSLYPEQVPNSEGERYELLCRLPIPEHQAQLLLTALGNLSMQEKLGHRHTIDVSAISDVPGLSLISLNHYSSSVIEGEAFGIYEIIAEQP
jgi:hypothetical protein